MAGLWATRAASISALPAKVKAAGEAVARLVLMPGVAGQEAGLILAGLLGLETLLLQSHLKEIMAGQEDRRLMVLVAAVAVLVRWGEP